MGVYIKGFIPTDGLYVIKDGVIRKYKGKGGTVRPYELVEVKEPHGRLIDADALLKRWCSEVCKTKPRCDEDCMFYDYLTIDSLSPTIEPETHWIPVSERLPEKDGYYLVSEDDCNIEVEWYDNTGWGYCGVIAWMPLPPVYQEEDNK